MGGFESWLHEVVHHLGYREIFILMAMESSVLPVPSELVMIPAGYRVAQGALDPWLVVLAGGFGSLAGATVNYLVGRFVGRAFLLRYGRWLLISEAKYHEAEALFLKNAKVATFVGRFIPAVRHFISLPAGVFGMAPLSFALLTTLGASLWCAVLAFLGYHLGEPIIRVVAAYSHWVGLAALGLIGVAGLWFLLRRSRS